MTRMFRGLILDNNPVHQVSDKFGKVQTEWQKERTQSIWYLIEMWVKPLSPGIFVGLEGVLTTVGGQEFMLSILGAEDPKFKPPKGHKIMVRQLKDLKWSTEMGRDPEWVRKDDNAT